MINVSSDFLRRLVRVDMAGFLIPQDVRQFNNEKEAAVERMGLRSGEFVLLVNTVGCVIQSQAVVAEFTNVVLHTRYKSRRLAVVRHDVLTRLQTRRIIGVRDNAAIFETEAAAVKWLFDTDASAYLGRTPVPAAKAFSSQTTF